MADARFQDSYPVFIVYMELEQRGKLPETYELDLIWEHCASVYESFLVSDFNDIDKSEYDCIVDYLNKNL